MTIGAQPLQFAVWGAREYFSALRSIFTGRVSVGPNSAKLQHDLTALYDQTTVLPVNAGRTALRLALGAFAARRPERLRVLMPDYLCPSAVAIVREIGLEPWPVEVGADLNLDPKRLTFDEHTLAVVAAHMYGCPAQIGDIERRCREADVFLIDDAAQVVGVRSEGRMLGTFGDAGIVSFAQSKTLVTGIRGSGGLLLINNPNLQTDLLRAYAKLPSPMHRLSSFILFLVDYLMSSHLGAGGYYLSKVMHAVLPAAQINPYTPALMSNLEAGIGLAQLARLPEILAARTRVADLYAAALSDISSVTLPQHAPKRFLSRCFIELPDPQTALLLRRGMLERKISTRSAYPPWSKETGALNSNPIADLLIEVPNRSSMTATDVAWVARAIRDILHELRLNSHDP